MGVLMFKNFKHGDKLKLSRLGIKVLGKGDKETAKLLRYYFIEPNPNNHKYIYVQKVTNKEVKSAHRDFFTRA